MQAQTKTIESKKAAANAHQSSQENCLRRRRYAKRNTVAIMARLWKTIDRATPDCQREYVLKVTR